jgi:ribosomal-protein-alanine N-acetyltransferase
VEDLTLPAGVVVRPMDRRDVNAVVAIEGDAFTTPWQADTFTGLLARDGAELLVMTDDDDTVVGYAILWCILDQGELANIAIVPARRGEGLGRALLLQVLDVARARGVQQLFLEVRASNEVAINLYLRQGFEEVGVRKNYYGRPPEDAKVMLAAIG